MKVFVFFIGGTGARVMRSLTMLLAAGAKIPQGCTLVPILLDMDLQNGDIQRTVNAIELYQKIHRITYGGNRGEQRSFFGSEVQLLGELQAENAQQHVGESVLSEITNHTDTFESYLKVQSMQEEDYELLKLLYDNSNRPQQAELQLNLSVGFKGNPNIGSVIFNAFEDSAVYKYFTTAFNNINDRIFIVSSIFGGTGSAGFPQLVKLLQQPSQKNEILKAKKGGITVMPYFALKPNPKSAIDQNRFIAKTRAALTYYHQQLNLDAMYFIGDQAGSLPYQNVEGGKQQQNKAHIVEMLAAEAVLHFARQSDFSTTNRFFEFGLKQKDSVLKLANFYDNTYKDLLLPLMRLSYATKICDDFIGDPNIYKRQAFAKSLNLPDDWENASLYTVLRSFIDQYKNWLKELAENDRSFNPFDFTRDLNALVREKLIKTNWYNPLDKGISDEFLKTNLGKIENKLKSNYQINEHRFMHMLIEISELCVKELGDVPRT